jgi:iron complex transport system ATP-binding protein
MSDWARTGTRASSRISAETVLRFMILIIAKAHAFLLPFPSPFVLRMPVPLLELHNATVVKNDIRILDRLTLTIHVAEHTAILGPNGSGKTTLINLLTHDDYPVAEDEAPPAVRVLGHDRWDVFELRSRLGIISSDMHHRFVAGHSAGRIRGEDAVLSGFFATQGFLVNWPVTSAMRTRARDALERLEAGHLAAKWMHEMSTGEARRVLIARALVAEPSALVLDEPSAGLDVAARFRFLETVRALARGGTTIVLITHHVEEIIPEIDRVVLLQRGRVLDDGQKSAMLTAERLGALFEAPVAVRCRDGYYSLTAWS